MSDFTKEQTKGKRYDWEDIKKACPELAEVLGEPEPIDPNVKSTITSNTPTSITFSSVVKVEEIKDGVVTRISLTSPIKRRKW